MAPQHIGRRALLPVLGLGVCVAGMTAAVRAQDFVADNGIMYVKQLNVGRLSTNSAELMLLGDASWWNAWLAGATEENAWHGKPGWHNAGFFDGHAEFTRFHLRIYGTEDYRLIPFKDLAHEAAKLQPPPWP